MVEAGHGPIDGVTVVQGDAYLDGRPVNGPAGDPAGQLLEGVQHRRPVGLDEGPGPSQPPCSQPREQLAQQNCPDALTLPRVGHPHRDLGLACRRQPGGGDADDRVRDLLAVVVAGGHADVEAQPEASVGQAA